MVYCCDVTGSILLDPDMPVIIAVAGQFPVNGLCDVIVGRVIGVDGGRTALSYLRESVEGVIGIEGEQIAPGSLVC